MERGARNFEGLEGGSWVRHGGGRVGTWGYLEGREDGARSEGF